LKPIWRSGMKNKDKIVAKQMKDKSCLGLNA
jgi:hypothetical protein